MNYHICGSSSYDSRHWCDWTPIAFDLRDYIGQEIRLTITTSDCIPQGHYGYGYFTARGAEGEITSDAWGSDSVRLSLPSGFASYTWYRGTEQIASGSRHVVVPRTRYENYHCATQSRTGAVMDFRTQVLSYSLAAAFETQILHNQVDFRNTGTISMLEDTIYTVPVTFIEWDFGDNTETSHEINPSHRYEHPGTYTVKCIIYGPDRLFSDTVTKEITIESIIPSAPSLITGPEVVSVGHFWYYTVEEVPYADSYEWNLEPADWPVTKINDREISIEVTSPGSAVLSVYARNEHGRSPDATKSISSTTGMEAFDEKRQLHVFPNPASDYIVVKHGCKDPENVSISIIDIAGKEIGRYIPDNDEKKIDIDSFIPGIYFIRLEESNKIIDTYKWIKY